MHLSPPIEPMLARPVTALPSVGATPALFEQKADGFRLLLFAAREPFLQARAGRGCGPRIPGGRLSRGRARRRGGP